LSRLQLVIAIGIGLGSRLAVAQPDAAPTSTPDAAPPEPTPDAAPPQPGPETEVVDDDLDEIQDAIDADLAAQKQAAQTQPEPVQGGGILQSMNPDISFILDVAAAWFTSHDDLQGGGHDPTENGFNLQQLELAIGKAVDPYFRFDGNLVFSQFGVEIEEVFGTTLALPYSLQARAGQFLTRFGRINPTHLHAWDFIDQPFAIGRIFGSEGNRGLGGELSWLTPAPFYLELVASATDASGEATARSFFGAEDLPVETPLDVQATLAVKEFFELSHDWSLSTGQSVATGPNGTGHDNRSDVYGVDIYIKYRPITYGSHTIVSLQTEWFYRRRQIPEHVLSDLSGYAYVLWRFAQRWTTAARYEYGSPARDEDGLAMGDILDPEWTTARHRVAANITFLPTEFSRLRAQLSVDVPRWIADPIVAAFFALELSVGAHGAHKF
jgi:hypothetical protein